MFEEIVTEEEIKFNNLEKKIFKFVCNFGCLIKKKYNKNGNGGSRICKGNV